MPVNTEIQQKTVLSQLIHSPRTTMELRELNVLSPAPRVQELREMGFNIVTDWDHFKDSDGQNHRIGRYHYLGHEELTQRGGLILASIYN